MEPRTLLVHRTDAGWDEWTRRKLQEFFRIPAGAYQLVIKEVKAHRSSRYKYHFGYVLPLIVEYMNQQGINQILDPGTGELLAMDVDTLHDYHKQVFNPCLVKNLLGKKNINGVEPEYITVPLSTTKLSDGEFINRYEEEIISTYADKYGLEFMGRDEWSDRMKAGESSKDIILNQAI